MKPKHGNVVFVDTHSDHYLEFYRDMITEDFGVICPAFYGQYGKVYPVKPNLRKISWLETDRIKREGAKRAFRKWSHPEKIEGKIDRLHIDIDGINRWDENLEKNIGYMGYYGKVPLEYVLEISKQASTLAVVEELHGAKRGKYNKFCLSKQAVDASINLNRRFGETFSPDVVYFILDNYELQYHYKRKSEKAQKNFEKILENIPLGKTKFRKTSYARNDGAYEERQLEIYSQIQRDMQDKKVMLISNTHSSTWLTEPWQTNFSKCPKKLQHYV